MSVEEVWKIVDAFDRNYYTAINVLVLRPSGWTTVNRPMTLNFSNAHRVTTPQVKEGLPLIHLIVDTK